MQMLIKSDGSLLGTGFLGLGKTGGEIQFYPESSWEVEIVRAPFSLSLSSYLFLSISVAVRLSASLHCYLSTCLSPPICLSPFFISLHAYLSIHQLICSLSVVYLSIYFPSSLPNVCRFLTASNSCSSSDHLLKSQSIRSKYSEYHCSDRNTVNRISLSGGDDDGDYNNDCCDYSNDDDDDDSNDDDDDDDDDDDTDDDRIVSHSSITSEQSVLPLTRHNMTRSPCRGSFST